MDVNKYDFDREIKNEEIEQGMTTYAKIISWISPNSKVLEFGPYKGRMTRYITGELGCEVYVVEKNETAFEGVKKYAADGICGDIEDYEWLEQWKHQKFDYVIFADVLEHLSDPVTVIKKVKEVITDEGAILMSVPNIAHADVISNLLQDRFHYTSVGLLDSTHIHFFSRESIRDMVNEAGLFLACEDATTMSPYHTEQGGFIENKDFGLLEQIIKYHPTAEVYQYVCKLMKKESVEQISYVNQTIYNKDYTPDTIRLYYDTGDGFTEAQYMIIPRECVANNVLKYRAQLPKGCVGIRFDPVDLQKCVVKDLEVLVDSKPRITYNVNGIRCGRTDLFLKDDPQIFIPIEKEERIIDISASIYILSFGNLSYINDFLCEQQRCNEKLQDEIVSLNKEKNLLEIQRTEYQETIATLEKEKAQLVDELNKYKEEKNDEKKEE